MKIKRALDGLRRIVTQTPSELCADARAVASTNYQTTPSATLQFIANVSAILKGPGVGGLTRVLGAFQARADRRVMANITHLLGQAGAAYEALTESVASKVEAALGLRP